MAHVIDTYDLEEKDVELLEALAERLRERARRRRLGEAHEDKDGFRRSAGAWKGLVDAEDLIKDIYQSRLVSTRTEINL